MIRKNILFIRKGNQSFVQKDIKFLTQHYNLIDQKYDRTSSHKMLLSILKQFFLFFRLLRNQEKDIIIIWFADYHALIPTFIARFFNTPVLLMLGGYDTVGIKKLNYGVFNSNLRGRIAKYVIGNATVVLPVTQKLIENLQQFDVKIKGQIIELPTSYDSDFWIRSSKKIRNTIVTVAHFDSKHRLLIKGIDRFINWANHSPELSFRLIGVDLNNIYLQEYSIPENLEVLGFLNRESIKFHYSQCSVYAQLSRSEGLPNAVCEAMLCECHIIGTEVGELVNLIEKNSGEFYSENFDNLTKFVKKIDAPNIKGRDYIKSHYSYSQREKILTAIVNSI